MAGTMDPRLRTLFNPFISIPISSQLLGVAEKYPGLLDGMVLMSSAPDVPALLTSFAASSIGIASLNNNTRFGEQRPSYPLSQGLIVYVPQVL